MGWSSAGLKNQPTAGTILADSGAMVAVATEMTLVSWATRAATLEVAQRNALNTADTNTQVVTVNIGSEDKVLKAVFLLNERIVIRAKEDVDGDIQVSLMW